MKEIKGGTTLNITHPEHWAVSTSAIVTNVPVVSCGTGDCGPVLRTLGVSDAGNLHAAPFALQHCRNASASPNMLANFVNATPMSGTSKPSRTLSSSGGMLRSGTFKQCGHFPRVVFIVLALSTATGIRKHSCFGSEPSSRAATYTAVGLRVVSGRGVLPGAASSKYTTWRESILASPGGVPARRLIFGCLGLLRFAAIAGGRIRWR